MPQKKKKTDTRYRMTKLEKFYIDHNLEIPAKTLAIELGIPETVINRYIKKTVSESKKIAEEHGLEKTTDQLMVKDVKYGTVCMTQNASMDGDETKANRGAGLKSRYYQNAIRKIR